MSPVGRPSLFERPLSGISEFVRWWRAALSGFVPKQLVRWFDRDPLELVLHVDPATGRSELQDHRGRRPVDREDLRRLARWYGPLMSATVVVPEQRALVRAISVPRAMLDEADNLLRIDLGRTTPFRAEDVLSGWYPGRNDPAAEQAVLNHVVVKRSVVARVVDDLFAARIPLKHVRVGTPFGGELPVDVLSAGEQKRAWISRGIRACTRVAAGFLVLGGLIWGGARYVSATNTLAAAEVEAAAVQKEYQSMRARLAETDRSASLIKRVRLRRLETQTLVGVWEEVSRLLPNGTWVSELRVDEGQLQIDGFSSNAAELPAILAKSSRFSDVRFVAPVTRDAGRSAERFQMRMRMGAHNAADASASGAKP